MDSDDKNICEIVRKAEREYTLGTTTQSKYVQFQMHDTLEKIEAYLNSKHISGEFDSKGRKKPFFNIVTAASNIYYRATDIDRKNIVLKPKKAQDLVNVFLANVKLQEWMDKNRFGSFLNEWGRTLANYGSAVIKFVENDGGLNIGIVPWQKLIVDQVEFEPNNKIEVLELTEAQLKSNKLYDQDVVEELCEAVKSRETLDKRRKDNLSNYIKLYEVHGNLPLSLLTGNDKDDDTYVQQMHVVSFVGNRKVKAGESKYSDFTLYAGREKKDPYMITHLIKADSRTLAIGAVERLFDSQWMMNHTVKSIKDQLDLASKLIFQTSDGNFLGQNAVNSIETGDILIHKPNEPLQAVGNTSHDITALQNFGAMWKQLSSEINGISEAMLGAAPKSGTAWRQTEATLQESYSLFELMTENKGLYIEDMMREYIIPFIKRQLNNADEVVAELDANQIEQIDAKYLKSISAKEVNKIIIDKVLKGETVSQDQQMSMMNDYQSGLKNKLNEMGNTRFFKPSDVPTKTWKEQFKDLEWEVDVDVTGEQRDTQSMLATLNTALQVIAQPGFEQNKKAQFIVNKILMATGYLSPLELQSFSSQTTDQPLTPITPPNGGSQANIGQLLTNNKQ